MVGLYSFCILSYKLSEGDWRITAYLCMLPLFFIIIPLAFAPGAIYGFVRGVQRKKRTIIAISTITGLISIGAYLFLLLRIVLAPIAILLFPPASPAVEKGSYPIQSVEEHAPPGLVLWDITHGLSFLPIDPIYDRTGIEDFYPQLLDELEKAGYKFDINEYGVLNLDISGYSAIVLNSAYGAAETPYTEEEAERLLDYVNAGGALLLFGEHAQTVYSQNLDPVSKKFGMDLSNEPYFDDVNVMGHHPIVMGLQSLQIISGGTILVSPPANAVAWHDSYVAIAVAEVGKGRVVAIGDEAFLRYNHYSQEGGVFTKRVLDWLTKKTY